MGINHLDITWFISTVDDVRDVVRDIRAASSQKGKMNFRNTSLGVRGRYLAQ